jgi:hypothetical protein
MNNLPQEWHVFYDSANIPQFYVNTAEKVICKSPPFPLEKIEDFINNSNLKCEINSEKLLTLIEQQLLCPPIGNGDVEIDLTIEDHLQNNNEQKPNNFKTSQQPTIIILESPSTSKRVESDVDSLFPSSSNSMSFAEEEFEIGQITGNEQVESTESKESINFKDVFQL